AALADRYAIERELGRGGMATVYLAEDRKHHRRVAIKVLKPELAATLGPERFLREIEIAAASTMPISCRSLTPERPAASSITPCRLWRANRFATGSIAKVRCPSRKPRE